MRKVAITVGRELLFDGSKDEDFEESSTAVISSCWRRCPDGHSGINRFRIEPVDLEIGPEISISRPETAFATFTIFPIMSRAQQRLLENPLYPYVRTSKGFHGVMISLDCSMFSSFHVFEIG